MEQIEQKKEQLPEALITEIQVDELFGLYSYKLSVHNIEDANFSKLLILYGDNGSGKTTLLKLIFNLLSINEARGHRSYIASVPFRRFILGLGIDTKITVERFGEDIIGTYTIRIINSKDWLFEGIFEANEENLVKGQDELAISYTKALKNLGITLFYLSDDRKTESSLFEENEQIWSHLISKKTNDLWARTNYLFHNSGLIDYPKLSSKIIKDSVIDKDSPLDAALRKLENWIESKVLAGTSEGEANTNTIYSDIVESIIRPPKNKKPSNFDTEEIKILLRNIEEQSKAFSAYSLISPLNFSGLLNTLDDAPLETKPIVVSILHPYVEGLRARLMALQTVQNIIEIFVDSINSFLHNKSISYDLRKGIQIYSSNGDGLNTNNLSSGERQLLLLFCNTITARETTSIFIIDEPEISLNVKWQRNLLKFLLRLTEDSPVQFLIATHSLELLAQYRPHVMRLSDKKQNSYV